MNEYFHIELTDTFSGEANFSWVKYFIVKAKTFQGAVSKLSKETGYSFILDYGDNSEQNVYKGVRACVMAFVSPADEQCVEGMKGNAKFL